MDSKKPNLSGEFVFSHSGDRSVGIPGESLFVKYEGDFACPDHRKDFLEALTEALSNIFDTTRLHVIEKHVDKCRYCQNTFDHLDEYCDNVCPSADCQTLDRERESRDHYESEVAA